MDNQKKDITSIYMLKAICAACVVYLHTWYANEYIFLFSKLAVPIFYSISGYFLFNIDSYFKDETMIRQIKKTIKLIVFSNLLYIIFYSTIWVFTDRVPIIIDSPTYILTWIFIGANLAPPLWYLNAYVEALISIYIFVRILNFGKYLPLLGFICFISSLLLGRYSYLINLSITKDWIFTNFLTISIPFIILGMYLKRYEQKLISHCWSIFILSLLLFIVEIECYKKIYSFGGIGYNAITSFLLVAAILIICLKYKNYNFNNNIMCIIGKSYSLQIFIMHFIKTCRQIYLILCINWFANSIFSRNNN